MFTHQESTKLFCFNFTTLEIFKLNNAACSSFGFASAIDMIFCSIRGFLSLSPPLGRHKSSYCQTKSSRIIGRFGQFTLDPCLLVLLVGLPSLSGIIRCGSMAVFSCWASFAFASRTACNEDLLSSFVFAASLVGLVVFISPVAFFISLSSFSRFCARFSSSLTAFSKAILFFSKFS